MHWYNFASLKINLHLILNYFLMWRRSGKSDGGWVHIAITNQQQYS